jgi:hypothetical protein
MNLGKNKIKLYLMKYILKKLVVRIEEKKTPY